MNSTIEEILKGSSLSNYYTIGKKINSGGFGTVFLAEKKDDKSLIAIKAFEPRGQALADHFNEIKVSKTLDHPHNIKVIDFFIYDSKNEYFILMELAQKSLNDLILEKGALDEELIFQILADVVSGLQYASDTKGISHCDLKPHNILLTDKKREKGTQTLFVKEPKTTFKLVDWGCAVIQERKINNTMTQTFKNPYTKAYSAPEIIQSAPKVNLMKADIYSLGLTLLTCCGVPCKKFKYINSLTEKEEHGNQVKKIIKSNDLDGKYKNLVKIISQMISYDHKERPDYKEILSKISEYQKERCILCKEKHEKVVELHNCFHVYGFVCLIKHFKSEFEKNPLYVPCCPNISCQNILETSELENVLGKKLFQKKYNKCSKCEKIILSLNSISFDPCCNHVFCFKCFKTFVSIFEIQSAKCLKCGENNGKLVNFPCCDAKLCEACILSVAAQIYQEKPCCLFCRRKLKTEVKSVLDHIVSPKKKEDVVKGKKSSSNQNKIAEENAVVEKEGKKSISNQNKIAEEGKKSSSNQNTIAEESKIEIDQKKQSTDNHKAESKRNEGFLYEKSNPIDYKQAFKCFLEAANLGDKIAMYKLGYYYLHGPKFECEKNDQNAISYFKKAAKLDYAPAACEAAKFFKKKGDLIKATKYFKQAAENDNAQANDELAIIYESQRDYELAIKYYKRSVELGFGPAANHLAWLYGVSNFIPKNQELANFYKKKAIDLGDFVNWNKNQNTGEYNRVAAHLNWLRNNGIENN